MSAGPPPRVRSLSIHADYRCRSSGACCSSGWPIPVEPDREEALRDALGAAFFRAVPGLPHGARVVVEATPTGRCVFLEADRRCAVHRRLGEGALPSACRHFPRVAAITPLGVSVTLSHYCPTAAATLFRDGGLAVVENPLAFPPSWPWEGLDARGALPPLLRPGVLMDWPSLERWEGFAVSALAEEDRTPEDALDSLAAVAEAARRWTPQEGRFDAFFERVLCSPSPARSSVLGMTESRWMTGAWRLVASTVLRRERLPPVPEGPGDAHARWVAPRWPSLARPVRRWLAAKAFASWLVLQGEGLRTAVLGLRVALFVLRAESARGCAEAGRALDADLLREAVRRADLLLVHLADPQALARRLSSVETQGRGAPWNPEADPFVLLGKRGR